MKIFRRIFRRKSSLWFGCLLYWGLCGFPKSGSAQQLKELQQQLQVLQPKILSITVSNVGPQNVGEALVRANIRLREGDAYNRNSVDDDIKNLHTTGFFQNVQVHEAREPDGIRLTYIVQPRLKITDILFSGNKKFSHSRLSKKLTTKIGDSLDDRKLFTDAQEIKKLYEKSGYPKTKVETVPTTDERTGRATVTFEITESPKIRIKDVVFDGASAYTQHKLRKVLKTRRHWWLSWLTQSGTLKEEQLEEDKEKLAEFYREAGYIDFELKEVRQVQIGPRRVELHFILSEGHQYKVGAVGFKGITLFPTNDLPPKLKMGVGQTFTPKGLFKDTETIQDLYGTKGYIDARVNPRKNPNTQTGTMDLVYEVVENDKAYIEKVEIKGNIKTKDRVIRRELAVAPGEVFDMVKVKRSVDRLKNLNYFEDQFGVDGQPETTDVPNRRNLVVSVHEKSTGNIQVGAAFSSLDALVGFVEVTQGNFDLLNPPGFQGAGQKARLRLALGTKRRDFTVAFAEPWFLERKLEVGVELYHHEFNFLSSRDVYDETRTGMRLYTLKALGTENLRGGLSYTLENVGLNLNPTFHGNQVVVSNTPFPHSVNVPANVSKEIAGEAGDRLVSKIGTSLTYETTDSYLLPTKGQRTELRADLAGGPFGGDSDFYKLEFKHARYVRGLYAGHLLEMVVGTGVAEGYGQSRDVPLFDRFFLGGLDTLRGYKYRAVGPRDEFAEPLGGDTYWMASAEYSVPIVERVRLAGFYDIGMVYKKAYHYDFSEYADNWGIGLRLLLPIGPLRLDYAIPIHNSTGREGSGRFQFSAGYRRNF